MRYKAKTGYMLRNQERKDLGLVNGKTGGGLEEFEIMCQHLLLYLGELASFKSSRTGWKPWFSNPF